MKQIVFLLLCMVVSSVGVYSQSTLPLRADTVVIEKVGGNANLKVKDASRDSIGGIYVNVGGGLLRAIRTKKINDTTYTIGVDTIRVGSGSTATMDSVLFATNYRLDTVKNNLRALIDTKLNISDTTNKWVNNIRRRPGTDTVEYFKNGSWVPAFLDSLGKVDTTTLKSVFIPLYFNSAKQVNQQGFDINFTGGGKKRFDSVSIKKTMRIYMNADSANGFGHSIMAGANASPTDSSYFVITARSFGLFPSNQGVGGSVVHEAVQKQMAYINPGHNAFTMYMPALNDSRITNILTSRRTLNYIINGLNAMWMNHMAKVIVGASDGSLTRVGTWSTNWNAASEGGKVTNGAFTSSAGDYIEYTFTDSTVGFQLMGVNSAGASSIQIKIDGVTVETFDCNNQYNNYIGIFAPMVKYYTGLSNTSHTLRVTNVSGGFMVMDYFTRLRDAATAPPICFFHEPHMNPAEYPNGQSSDAAIDTINVKYDSLYNSLPAPWKARTLVAKTNTRYDATTADCDVDNVHPSNQGHRKIALAFSDAYRNVISSDSGTVQYGDDGFLYVDAKKIPYFNTLGLKDVINNNNTLDQNTNIYGNTINFNSFSNINLGNFKIKSDGNNAFMHGTLGTQGTQAGLYVGFRDGDTTKGFTFYGSGYRVNLFDLVHGRTNVSFDTSYHAAFYNNPYDNVFINPTATIHIGGNRLGEQLRAPLKINFGKPMTTPEAGAIEAINRYWWLVTDSLGKRDTLATRSWFRDTVGISGTISGSGTSGRIAYWNGSTSLTSNSNFLFNGTSFSTGTTNTQGQLNVGGSKSLISSGAQSYFAPETYTDAATAASSTANSFDINLIASPTIAATNTGVTFPIISTLSIVAPTAGTNATINKRYALLLSGSGANLGVNGFIDGITQLRPTGSGAAIAAGAGAGTGASGSVTGGDVAGKIDITTGTSPSTSAAVVTITFNAAYASAPTVIIQPTNAAAAALSGTGQVFVSSTSTTNFVVTVGSTALGASTQYTWSYHVIQ